MNVLFVVSLPANTPFSEEEEGGGGQAFICDAAIDHFWCSWIVMYWKTVLWIVIDMHYVKPELPKSLIVYSHIADQSKKINC